MIVCNFQDSLSVSQRTVFHDHNYTAVDYSQALPVTEHNYHAYPSPAVVLSMNSIDANSCLQTTVNEKIMTAPDPELEEYHVAVKTPSKSVSTSTDTIFAAWVLVTLFLLSSFRQYGATNIIGEIYQLSTAASVTRQKQTKPYSKRVMIFCMTLAGYSAKAYSFLRSSFKNCLPSCSTLKRYRNRADGSPGFSSAALQMIKSKVGEMSQQSKKLFLSLSCDDISIRFILVHILL
jgi:hypothetical protein